MKKGISLIVLSITILVMAIIAATVIISLEDSGIIGRAKNTTKNSNYADEYTRLTVIKNGILTDNLGEITVEEYINELDNQGILESGRTNNADGSVTVTTKSGYEVTISQNGTSDLTVEFDGVDDSNDGNNNNSPASGSVAIEFDDNMYETVTVTAEKDKTWEELINNNFTVTFKMPSGDDRPYTFSKDGEYIKVSPVSGPVPGVTQTKVKLTDKYGDYSHYYIIVYGGGNYLYGDLIGTIITFTIGGVQYQAEEGMTWDDFINSKYNDGSFMKSGPKWFYNGIVMYPSGTYIVDGETVSLT